MTVRIVKPPRGGTVRAISSKSEAHRLLICAALAERKTTVGCPDRSEDIDATARCLNELGAAVDYIERAGGRNSPGLHSRFAPCATETA